MTQSIPIYIRYSDLNETLHTVTHLSKENYLVFNDDGKTFKAHVKTAAKFTLLSATSSLITISRLVRSAVFLCTQKFDRAGREFIGALATPLITAGCLLGTLASSLIYVISLGQVSFHTPMRRTYAFFEAWVNQIDLKGPFLESYSSRVSRATDCSSWIWTTAPCMQPILENGDSEYGGLLDTARMREIFPFIPIDDVQMENGNVVLQSHYQDKGVRYTACNGLCEHIKQEFTCCCFWRVEAVYDRFLCCEVSKGSCTSTTNSDDSCGLLACALCGVGTCCCYAQEKGRIQTINTGCFGPNDSMYLATYQQA